MKTHYYLYKITNLMNGHIYVGVHQTDDMDDGYMGSGKLIKAARRKHGDENFIKEILQEFDNPDDMFSAESELVNEEFVSRQDTYNMMTGGKGGAKDFVSTSGGYVHKTDPRYVSGEFQHMCKGLVTVKDKDGNTMKVSTSDPRYLSGELVYYRKDIPRSEETINKIKTTMKERNHQKGENNAGFGTIWIRTIDGKESKRHQIGRASCRERVYAPV